ncbi:PerC family transcriptional regulator [Serratia nevei]|uniref:PerC family transcriptional regulator n=1 Tax=Serratia nevei TaxID=2703794 RepID=UPI002860534C|nr:PerC family transcriptional regulator [Serratia nevei]MDR8490333.1 PerC family transcriptional regulator [Serratia nevei]
MKVEKAEALERSGLWRRAARCWLEVMDRSIDEAERERVAQRRAYCITMANGISPGQRRYRKKLLHRVQKSADEYQI